MPRNNSPARRDARYAAAVARQTAAVARRPDVAAPVTAVMRAADRQPTVAPAQDTP